MGEYALPSVVGMYALMGACVGATAFFLLRALATGAVADDESPKYRMLEDEGEERSS